MRSSTCWISLMVLSACGAPELRGFAAFDASADLETAAPGNHPDAVMPDMLERVDGAVPPECVGAINHEGCPCPSPASTIGCYPGAASQEGVGSCTLGQQTCVDKGEFGGPTWGPCVGAGAPSTCASLGAACGAISDGCGGTLDCGTCSGMMTCGGGGVAHQCGGPSCPTGVVVSFDWGTHGGGRCTATISANSSWVYTNTTDAYVGGFAAQCVNGVWQISQEKCVARGPSMTCFPSGTPCNGAGPAVFPYPHCWTCCDKQTDTNGPACL